MQRARNDQSRQSRHGENSLDLTQSVSVDSCPWNRTCRWSCGFHRRKRNSHQLFAIRLAYCMALLLDERVSGCASANGSQVCDRIVTECSTSWCIDPNAVFGATGSNHRDHRQRPFADKPNRSCDNSLTLHAPLRRPLKVALRPVRSTHDNALAASTRFLRRCRLILLARLSTDHPETSAPQDSRNHWHGTCSCRIVFLSTTGRAMRKLAAGLRQWKAYAPALRARRSPSHAG